MHNMERHLPCSHPGCEHAAPSLAALARHERAHAAEPHYACDVTGCNYASKKRSHLGVHARTHTLKVQDVVPTGGGVALSSCCTWGRAHAVAVDSSLRVRAMRQEGQAGMVRVRVEERTRHYALQRHPH